MIPRRDREQAGPDSVGQIRAAVRVDDVRVGGRQVMEAEVAVDGVCFELQDVGGKWRRTAGGAVFLDDIRAAGIATDDDLRAGLEDAAGERGSLKGLQGADKATNVCIAVNRYCTD